jgi:hypothetical protein
MALALPTSVEGGKAGPKRRTGFWLAMTLGALALVGCVQQDSNRPRACAKEVFGGGVLGWSSITEGAFDEGNSIISVLSGGFGHNSGMARNQVFVECRSGVGVTVIASELSFGRTFDEPDFHVENQHLLLDAAIENLRSSGQTTDFPAIYALSQRAPFRGGFARSYRQDQASEARDYSEDERCGCNAYYPGNVRNWPKTSEADMFPTPETLEELEALIRARQPAEKTEE